MCSVSRIVMNFPTTAGQRFCAQNQRRLHFGLGRGARAERVQIRWPSGRVQTIDAPETGKLHRVKEAVSD